jgi:hypothetical protein
VQEGVKRNFILQQGFEEPAAAACPRQYSALHFQPRTVFLCVLAGILFHSAFLFYALCATLWWSALLPKLNPFDAVYNLIFGHRALFALRLLRRRVGPRKRWRGRLHWRADYSFISACPQPHTWWKGCFWPPSWRLCLVASVWARSCITCWAGGGRSPIELCPGRLELRHHKGVSSRRSHGASASALRHIVRTTRNCALPLIIRS